MLNESHGITSDEIHIKFKPCYVVAWVSAIKGKPRQDIIGQKRKKTFSHFLIFKYEVWYNLGKSSTSYVFFIINMDIRSSLNVPRLISHILKLTTM